MKLNRKFWGFCLTTVIIVVGGSLIGWDSVWRSLAFLFNRETLVQFFSSADNSPVQSVLLFLAAHMLANTVGVPGTLLVVVGGAVYGLWWGTVLSTMGATMGAVGAFWVARYLLRDRFQKKFAHRPLFKKLNETLCNQGLGCILIIRFSPVSPFNVVNFALGLTPVSIRAYALGTLIGIIPGTLAYTWLGVTGAQALSSGELLPLFCCLTVLMLLSILPLVVQRYSAKPKS